MNPQLTMTLADSRRRELTASAAARADRPARDRAAKPRHRLTWTRVIPAAAR
jgi:hypothetical protein